MPTVFVSYCRDDRTKAAVVLSELDAAGIDYWLDESDILPSTEFAAGIIGGLTEAEWFMLLMTPQSAESEFVKDELHWALSNRSGKVIPLMLEKCNPVDFHLRMLRIQYVDLTVDDESAIAAMRKCFALMRKDESLEPIPSSSAEADGDELIALMLTFLPRYHQKHLRNLLASSDSECQDYHGNRTVRHELRDLCAWGLMSRCPGTAIGQAAADGRRFMLSKTVALTELGSRLAAHVK